MDVMEKKMVEKNDKCKMIICNKKKGQTVIIRLSRKG